MSWTWGKPKHEHDFRAVAVQETQIAHYGTTDRTDATSILWRCECGDVESTHIDGVWTLEQITGRSQAAGDPASYAELKELRRMAGLQ